MVQSTFVQQGILMPAWAYAAAAAVLQMRASTGAQF